MALNKKTQLPDTLVPIKIRYLQLLDKVNRTTSGNLNEIIGGQSFTIVDNTGETGLLRLLQVSLYPYNVESTDYNAIIDSVNNNTEGIIQSNIDIVNAQNAANDAMPKAGGTFIGITKSQSNTSYTVAQVRNIILSTNDAVVGSMQNGEIWVKYV